MARPSVRARARMMALISGGEYGWVGMMRRRASRSGGMPWGCGGRRYDGAEAEFVVEVEVSEEWMGTRPRLEARMTSGAKGDSRARVRDVKVSRSSMWT